MITPLIFILNIYLNVLCKALRIVFVNKMCYSNKCDNLIAGMWVTPLEDIHGP